MVNNVNYIDKRHALKFYCLLQMTKDLKSWFITGPTEEKPEVPAAELQIPIQLEKVEKKTMQTEEDYKEVEKDEKVKPMEEKKLSGILKKDTSRKFSLMEGRDCVTEKQP